MSLASNSEFNSQFDQISNVEINKSEVAPFILKGAFRYERTFTDAITKEELHASRSLVDPHYIMITDAPKVPLYIIERDVKKKGTYTKFFYGKIPENVHYDDPAWPSIH